MIVVCISPQAGNRTVDCSWEHLRPFKIFFSCEVVDMLSNGYFITLIRLLCLELLTTEIDPEIVRRDLKMQRKSIKVL